MGDKVIMIGEDCPGFKVPAEVGGEFEKPALENVEPLWRMEMMCFSASAGRDEIGAGCA